MPIRQGIKQAISDFDDHVNIVGGAEDGAEALLMIRQHVPHLVITDIEMPRINGIELIKQAQEHFLDIDFIVISSYSEFAYAQQALRYNVSDYLLKPINRTELAKTIEKLRMKRENGQRTLTTDAHNKDDDHESPIIRKVKKLVHENISSDISLQHIAQQVSLNYQYLSALFKEETHENFSEYVLRCRMDRAKRLLRETHLKVYEIAELCGYANDKYFVSQFSKYVGRTATQYRADQDKESR